MAAMIPPGQRVYAIGDIHGRFDLLEALHGAICEDAAAVPNLDKTIIYLGDYIDRGSQVYEVVDALASDVLPGLSKICLKGNHEDMILGFLASTFPFGMWLVNGGDATLVGYDVDIPPLMSASALAFGEIDSDENEEAKIRANLAGKIPPAHIEFYNALTLYHRCGDYIFVHAGVRPGIPVERQDPQDLLWIRDTFIRSDADHGGVVVHGHSIFDDVDIKANRIGVDTGAWRSECLSCVVLEGEDLRIIQT
ncbi:MAG: metallophosphoesterase [Proteobacteria bacterium]|nr:metallophosphoesterase [Pseudomonadota bacterium]